MPVTTTYTIQKIKNLDLTAGPQTDSPSVIPLSGGGFAAAGNHVGQTDIDFFNSSGTDTGSSLNHTGVWLAMVQLTNGNIALATQESAPFGAQLHYKIVSASGSLVLATTTLSDAGVVSKDIAALTGGGFVLVSSDADASFIGGGSDYEIDVRVYNNSGALQSEFVSASGSTFSGLGSSVSGGTVAALNDGGFVVAWEADNLPVPPNPATLLGKYAIYNANGSIRFSAANLGGTDPDSISVVSQSDGGFAIAYADRRWDTDTEITLEQFNAAGTRIRTTRITTDAEPNVAPDLTRLSNGFLALAYTQDYGTDTDTVVAVIDPSTGAVLDDIGVLAGEDLFDSVRSPVMAGFGNGQLAVFHTNTTDSDIDGEHLQFVRNSTGDGLANDITGDSLADSMVGAGGNDTLNGGLGNDTLTGGTGDDFYNGVESGDVIVEVANEGTDTITTSASGLTVAANVENLTLLGVGNLNAIGNILGNLLTGNAGNNNLNGGFGDDTLAGNSGVDTLEGSFGNDTADYSGTLNGVTVSLASGSASNDGYSGADVLSNIENITGSGHHDSLMGNGLGNVLRGGLGNDTLDGSIGVDKATFSGFSGAYTVTRNGLTTTVIGPDGTDTLTGIELLQFGDSSVRTIEHAERDLGDDGRSDVLWRNDAGPVLNWVMNGPVITSSPLLASVSADWKIADGSGDYNGDGKSDVLWRNDSGGVLGWLMNGSAIASSPFIASVTSDWKIADGAGDYNGDGKSDVLWRNDDGRVLLWQMDGGSISSSALVASVGTDWKIADGSGDYDGDGKSDILWRNDNGNVLLWQMNGATIVSNPFVASVPIDWKIADGSGDYNGDGKSDVLWRNDNGNVLLWQMNGSAIASSPFVASVPIDWQIADGSGDYNGDGKSDVLWRNDNGNVLTWTMDGGGIISAASVASVPADWHIQS